MREVLEEIQTGGFARDWILENQAGLPQHSALMRRRREHPIEQVGKALRDRMSWLAPTNKAPERAPVAESRTQAA